MATIKYWYFLCRCFVHNFFYVIYLAFYTILSTVLVLGLIVVETALFIPINLLLIKRVIKQRVWYCYDLTKITFNNLNL